MIFFYFYIYIYRLSLWFFLYIENMFLSLLLAFRHGNQKHSGGKSFPDIFPFPGWLACSRVYTTWLGQEPIVSLKQDFGAICSCLTSMFFSSNRFLKIQDVSQTFLRCSMYGLLTYMKGEKNISTFKLELKFKINTQSSHSWKEIQVPTHHSWYSVSILCQI